MDFIAGTQVKLESTLKQQEENIKKWTNQKTKLNSDFEKEWLKKSPNKESISIEDKHLKTENTQIHTQIEKIHIGYSKAAKEARLRKGIFKRSDYCTQILYFFAEWLGLDLKELMAKENCNTDFKYLHSESMKFWKLKTNNQMRTDFKKNYFILIEIMEKEKLNWEFEESDPSLLGNSLSSESRAKDENGSIRSRQKIGSIYAKRKKVIKKKILKRLNRQLSKSDKFTSVKSKFHKRIIKLLKKKKKIKNEEK